MREEILAWAKVIVSKFGAHTVQDGAIACTAVFDGSHVALGIQAK